MAKPANLGIKHVSRTYDETLDFIKKRASGEERSILTPWASMNDGLLDGIPWNSVTVIGARPGTGKTLIASLITRNSFALNPTQDFVVLDFQYEMLARNSALRDLGRYSGKSMRQLNSCRRDGIMTAKDIADAEAFFNMKRTHPIYVKEEPCTVARMAEILPEFCDDPRIKGKRVIVTLDHTLLVKQDTKTENSSNETLYHLGAFLSTAKRQLPVTFIILSQLKQEVDGVERTRIPLNHYPVMRDILGADSITQNADTVIIMNRPAKNQIWKYGPKEFNIVDDKVMAVHIVKGRDGGESMFWLKADFEHMNILDMPHSEIPLPTSSAAPAYSGATYKK